MQGWDQDCNSGFCLCNKCGQYYNSDANNNASAHLNSKEILSKFKEAVYAASRIFKKELSKQVAHSTEEQLFWATKFYRSARCATFVGSDEYFKCVGAFKEQLKKNVWWICKLTPPRTMAPAFQRLLHMTLTTINKAPKLHIKAPKNGPKVPSTWLSSIFFCIATTTTKGGLLKKAVA